MTTTNPSAALGRCFALVMSLLVAAQLNGQTAPSGITPEKLAKYDKNKNGKLDSD